ncbi:threonylcarbamoyl-AMP synthase [Candidatus Woesearchaeota archaeon CG10_big_fil_rev_8_21_14_0_10_44_13]|nr:MAG: threonylcarbamoyl-AMP synthase [Candidatus Woesearchaeota archaeon CG10_big_fil_rev_8_21_14_0_10_44_13]
MRVITKEEFLLEANNLLDSVLKGAVFIYPTDTIYGIGCNALDTKAVGRIREAKKRPDAPFSVIAPSKGWILENCEVDDKGIEWLEKLPGPYTLVFKLKNRKCIAKEINPESDFLGVRIPEHWTTKIASSLKVPIVTTSVNESGKTFMTSLDNLDSSVKAKVDFMIDEGEKKGRPSNVVFLNNAQVAIRERQKGEHYPEKKKI